MGNFRTITNASFDTLCASVSGPYGPLTRVGSVSSVTPNSHIEVLVEADNGVQFSISYNDLEDVQRRQQIIHQVMAEYTHGPLRDVFAAVLAAASYIRRETDSGLEATPREYSTALNLLRHCYHLMTLLPVGRNKEFSNAKQVRLEGVTATETSAGVFDVTGNVVGDVSHVMFFPNQDSLGYLVDMDENGGFEFTTTDFVPAYTSDTTGQLVAIGPGGAVIENIVFDLA
jgi:hypothetical protein